MRDALMSTDLPLPNKRTGKVRDLYDVTLPDGETGVLIIATDRLSAFDVVMANGVPGKGIVLTQLSKFWFDWLGDRVRHHLVSTDPADIDGLDDAQQRMLNGRIMLCRKTDVVPIECIARGYLAGTGWRDYQQTGEVCGQALPPGLRNGDQLPEPLFTPSTKPTEGHDQNISREDGADLVGVDLMDWLEETTLSLYAAARDYAASCGIILADTKFEFGTRIDEAQPLLIDEIFTPDSSRFWPADAWRPGQEQPSFDKQYVRDYLEALVAKGQWNKQPPGLTLPDDVVEATLSRYLDAYQRLTGTPLDLSAY
jgi:phosphoribosylaminoimidazole-succinocarboxamide synthase